LRMGPQAKAAVLAVLALLAAAAAGVTPPLS
jgi:hypothetical protein